MSQRLNAFSSSPFILQLGAFARAQQSGDSAIVKLLAHRFDDVAPSCATAFFIDQSGLLLTSYQAIRGAESLELVPRRGEPVYAPVGVADYSVEQGLAVLHVNRDRAPALPFGAQVAAGDVVTHLGYGSDPVPVSRRVRINGWRPPPSRMFTFTGNTLSCGTGGPVLNGAGLAVGVVTDSTAGVPIDQTISLIERARRSVANGRVISARDVADREHHAYGSILFLSESSTLHARISPPELLQWVPAQEFATPFTFTGPMGRYQVNVLLESGIGSPQFVEVQPRVLIRFMLTPGASADRGGRSALPAILVLTGVAGGGVGAGLFWLSGGGEGDPPQTGSITVTWQDPNR